MRKISAVKARKVIPGVNVLTPIILGFFQCGQQTIELSEGRGLDNQPIYGVTVRPDKSQSKLFTSLVDAYAHIHRIDEREKKRETTV